MVSEQWAASTHRHQHRVLFGQPGVRAQFPKSGRRPSTRQSVSDPDRFVALRHMMRGTGSTARPRRDMDHDKLAPLSSQLNALSLWFLFSFGADA